MNQPEEMSAFEKQLGASLQRVDAPDGFAQRVLAQAALAPAAQTPSARAKVIVMPHRRIWAAGAIAATLLAGVFAADQIHLRQQRAQAEQAQQQFETALRITDESLDHARQQLQQAGVHLGN